MLIAVHSSRMQSSKKVSQHSRRLLVKGYPVQPARVLRKGNHILLLLPSLWGCMLQLNKKK